ncbi:MAG: GNAT family N-acetyltransferase [Candidatus Eisenbacteria bacterium]
MKLTMRAYEASDFWKIRAFLRETFLLNGREETNWQAYRFEYWVWHGVANLDQGPLEEKVFLWETPDGALATVLNAEGKGDNRADVTWYRSIQKAPLYRRDLDIVAVAPDGAVASFCTIWFDDITLTAACEPVATSPAHQRKGLARACIHEGLRRAKEMGATLGFVGSGEEGAHRCYASAGFKDYSISRQWVKEVQDAPGVRNQAV